MTRPAFSASRFKAFGWILHRKVLAAGDRFSVKVDTEYLPANGNNISLWTKGRVTGINNVTGLPTAERLPGDTILTLPIVPVSDSHFVAEVDSEFWCINYVINRNRLPEVELFCIKVDETHVWPKDTMLMFCAGKFLANEAQYDTPMSVIVESELLTVTAVEDVYGFVFKNVA